MYLNLTELRQVITLIEKQEGISPKLKNVAVNIICSKTVLESYEKEGTIKTVDHKYKSTTTGAILYESIKYDYRYGLLRIFG